MSFVWDLLLDVPDETFGCFDSVYLFGSSLVKDEPEDIDLLLVYRKGLHLRRVEIARQQVLDALCGIWDGIPIDLTTLNKVELAETGFLEKIRYLQIK